MKIKVKTCADCPFLDLDWFPAEYRDVRKAYCKLWFYLYFKDRMIASRPASVSLNLLMPEWCPLETKSYTIEVDKQEN
jgi:hypothetical protein